MTTRIHITGGSGSGTTTLGAHLALALRLPHHDTDDYFWDTAGAPYSIQRDTPERLDLMRQMFLPRSGWVLSGSLMGWGDVLIPHFDLVVLLTLPPDLRMSRLTAREAFRHGHRMTPGGDMAEAHDAFMHWAARYDDPTFTGRSLQGHLAWCADLPCPVLQLDSRAPVVDLVAQVVAARP